ncbi:hypothetical protein M2282_003281 [Variovorax boronicumulans]|uniref:hypothetical protein n=1 Tax=Variovorax boronicumulans TaxID=436515 RepID=UPI0024760CB6|nr:hypothetical protein [Variovorax boronicumulans]MDH6168130.1 hypothetical protein [Variovorax boronicumulans]
MKSFLLLLCLTALTACGSYSVKPPPSIASDPEINASSLSPAEGLDVYFAFNAALTQARRTPSSEHHATLLGEGMELISANCTRYFSRLGAADQHLRFARRETVLTGGVVATALGLANSTPKVIANTAALFAFGAATIDGYSETYVFSPDVKAVQSLVISALNAQKALGDGLIVDAQASKYLSYTKVANFLLVMESSCQPHGIRELVNRAVLGLKAVPVDATAGVVPPAVVPPAVVPPAVRPPAVVPPAVVPPAVVPPAVVPPAVVPPAVVPPAVVPPAVVPPAVVPPAVVPPAVVPAPIPGAETIRGLPFPPPEPSFGKPPSRSTSQELKLVPR